MGYGLSYTFSFFFQRWARCFRDDTYHHSINTNNGVEAQNKALKYKYLPRRRTTTFSGIITLLNEDYFPDCYRKYVFLNFKQSDQYRSYNDIVPAYLQGRPRQVIIHCLDRKVNSAKFDISDVLEADTTQGRFTMSGSKERSYKIHFGDDGDISPECSCPDFTEWHIPCKHFFAIFRLFPQWGWSKLADHYLNGPYLTTDQDCIISFFANDGLQEVGLSEQTADHDETVTDTSQSQNPTDNIPTKVNYCT